MNRFPAAAFIGLVVATGCGEGEPTVSAYVESVPLLDSDCRSDPEMPERRAQGLYDLTGPCNNDYQLPLWILAQLPQAALDRRGMGLDEPDVLEVAASRIELQTFEGTPIQVTDPAQANPFDAPTEPTYLLPPPGTIQPRGYRKLISVRAIPHAYAQALADQDRTSILVRIELEASVRYRTNGVYQEEEVPVEPFTFPIDLCEGCLTECLSSAPDLRDSCTAIPLTGMDDRICLDPSC
jgi:hypothetical protein